MRMFNPDCPLDQELVIPAQAGIQLIELGFAGMGGFLPNSQKFPRSGSTSRLCPLRGLFMSLDSRLRGNDGANGLFGINLLLTATLCALLGSFSPGAQAADGAVKLTSIAQVEVEAIDQKGKKTRKRIPVEKAVPGTEVIYTTTFENVGNKPASNIVINNPLPNDSEYKAGSAFGKDSEILFSADGGKKFGHAEELKIKAADGKERTALPKEYTHIRWTYKVPLAAGKSGEVGFRVTVK